MHLNRFTNTKTMIPTGTKHGGYGERSTGLLSWPIETLSPEGVLFIA